MKTILAPVDYSAAAANAAEFAGNLAAFYGADLWLYHVYSSAASIAGHAFSSGNKDSQSVEMKKLEELRNQLRSSLPYSINIHIKTKPGALRDCLPAFCKELNPDMVVMGISGKTGFAKLLGSDNIIKAVHYLDYPVLVVPQQAKFIPVRKIGFPCNYEKVAQYTTFSLLGKIIDDFNAELFVLNVHSKNKNYKLEEVMGGVLVNEMLGKYKPAYHTIAGDDVTEGINSLAEQDKLDWIVAVPKAHDFMESFFKHSHTNDLLHHTHVPVLCIHE